MTTVLSSLPSVTRCTSSGVLGAPPAAPDSGRPEDASPKEILLGPFVVVAAVVLGVVLGLIDWIVDGFKQPPPRRPAASPKRQSRLACGGMAGGCPVCLAASVALGVVVGDWLSGDRRLGRSGERSVAARFPRSWGEGALTEGASSGSSLIGAAARWRRHAVRSFGTIR